MRLGDTLFVLMLAASAVTGSANAQAGFERPAQTLQDMVAHRGVLPVAETVDAGARFYAVPDRFSIISDRLNPYPALRTSPDSERQVRSKIDSDASRLFHAENFMALEKMAKKLRTSDRLMQTGESRLEAFYESFRFCHCLHREEVSSWRSKADRYRRTFPGSPTPLLILAAFLVDDAWYGLQNGPGGSTIRGMIYRSALDDAARLLTTNWDIASQDDHAFALLAIVRVSSEVDQKELGRVVDQIAAGAPDYAPAWFSIVDGLTPLWSEDPQQVERIARRAAAVGDEGLYARVLHRAWEATQDNDFLMRASPDRKLLRASALRFVSQHPDVSNFAIMAELACAVQDWEMAEPLVIRLQALGASGDRLFPRYAACRRDLHGDRNRAG